MGPEGRPSLLLWGCSGHTPLLPALQVSSASQGHPVPALRRMAPSGLPSPRGRVPRLQMCPGYDFGPRHPVRKWHTEGVHAPQNTDASHSLHTHAQTTMPHGPPITHHSLYRYHLCAVLHTQVHAHMPTGAHTHMHTRAHRLS